MIVENPVWTQGVIVFLFGFVIMMSAIIIAFYQIFTKEEGSSSEIFIATLFGVGILVIGIVLTNFEPDLFWESYLDASCQEKKEWLLEQDFKADRVYKEYMVKCHDVTGGIQP